MNCNCNHTEKCDNCTCNKQSSRCGCENCDCKKCKCEKCESDNCKCNKCKECEFAKCEECDCQERCCSTLYGDRGISTNEKSCKCDCVK